MTKEDITHQLKELIINNFIQDLNAEINETTTLLSLGIDSVALMSIFVLLEEVFDIVIEEEDIFIEFVTVSDLVDFVSNKKKVNL